MFSRDRATIHYDHLESSFWSFSSKETRSFKLATGLNAKPGSSWSEKIYRLYWLKTNSLTLKMRKPNTYIILAGFY